MYALLHWDVAFNIFLPFRITFLGHVTTGPSIMGHQPAGLPPAPQTRAAALMVWGINQQLMNYSCTFALVWLMSEARVRQLAMKTDQTTVCLTFLSHSYYCICLSVCFCLFVCLSLFQSQPFTVSFPHHLAKLPVCLCNPNPSVCLSDVCNVIAEELSQPERK